MELIQHPVVHAPLGDPISIDDDAGDPGRGAAEPAQRRWSRWPSSTRVVVIQPKQAALRQPKQGRLIGRAPERIVSPPSLLICSPSNHCGCSVWFP
jgi:hypothetical protein